VATQRGRRLLCFRRYAAAVRSTAHTPHDGGLHSVLGPGAGRFATLFDRRTLAIQRPAEIRPQRSPRNARGEWRDRPSIRPSLAWVPQSMRLYLILYYSWEADWGPSTKFAKQRVSVSSHHDTSAQAYLLGRRHGRGHVDNNRVLSPAGAFCQILAGSLGRIICELRWPVGR
jgi:hypothetical protein